MKKIIKSIFILSLIVFTSCETQEVISEPTNTNPETYNKVQEETCPDEDSDGPNHPPEPDHHWRIQSSSLDLHRNFRDNFLLKNNKYKKYVDYYYSFSKEVSFFDFAWETKVKIWDSKNNLNNPLFNFLDSKYNGVIITEDLKNLKFN